MEYNWRKIGKVLYMGGPYHLYLSEDNSLFGHSTVEGTSSLYSGHPIGAMEGYFNEDYYALVKPIVDRALADANDPSISPNARPQ